MKTYTEYKESGTFWIDSYPNHWELCKLKFSSRTIAGGTPDTKKREYWDGNIPWLPSGVVQNCDVYEEDADTFITKLGLEKSAAKMIPSESILIALTGATCANIAHLHFQASANQSVIAMPGSKKINNRYLFYSLLAYRNQILINKTGGAQSGINDGNVKNTEILRPPLPEQLQIAAYLDYKTTQIDRFIANRKKQIELLEEQKEAIINKAVTKGIDPTVKLKPSGVDWIGDIPEHWEVSKVKFVSKVVGRVGFKGYAKSDLVSEGEGALTLGAKHIQKQQIDLTHPEFISWAKYYESPEIMVETGDILITQRGSLGKVAVVNSDIGKATINPSMLILKKVKINSQYLYYLFTSKSVLNFIDLLNSATAVPMISQDQVKNIAVILPPKNEMIQIVQFIKQEHFERNELISKYQKQIALMQEYKTSLISKAVTGKIDVREWQPKQTLKETV